MIIAAEDGPTIYIETNHVSHQNGIHSVKVNNVITGTFQEYMRLFDNEQGCHQQDIPDNK